MMRTTAVLFVPVVLMTALTSWSQVTGAEPPIERAAPTSQSATAPTNVVIFLIDTLRADRLGVYGYDRRKTSPVIDALAAESVVFENATAAAPWTLPSVVSLMTSTFPCEHQTLTSRDRLHPDLVPLAERFRAEGYSTLGWVSNAFAGSNYGLHRGFDYFVPRGARKGSQLEEPLERVGGRSFFLYIHNIQPHSPFRIGPRAREVFEKVPASAHQRIKEVYVRYRAESRVDFSSKRPIGTTDNSEAQAESLAELSSLTHEYSVFYDSAVLVADRQLGSTIETLRRRKLWDRTLFILLSDHGEEMNEHGGWLHDQSAYGELLHVPLIVKFPRGQYGGTRVSQPVSLVDILPTLADVLGMPSLAADARGRSLMPLMSGQPDESWSLPRVVGMRHNKSKYYRPWKTQRGDINVVVRENRWKGIWNVETDELELYDLEADPGEQTDLKSSEPDRALALRGRAREWYEKCGTHSRSPTEPVELEALDAETLKQLRALGYID